jgi:hypothetical protein
LLTDEGVIDAVAADTKEKKKKKRKSEAEANGEDTVMDVSVAQREPRNLK